jgi:hypothetical protein
VAKILANDDVPKYVKAKVKRVATGQRGGTTGVDYTLKKFKCGGGGCVYKIMKQNNEDAYPEVLLKLFNFNIKNELKKQFCDNIGTVLFNKKGLIPLTSFTTDPTDPTDPTDHKPWVSSYIYKDVGNAQDGKYGYYVKRCDGSIDEQQLFDANQLTTIRDKIVTMNSLNIVHGDIKFPNILFKKNTTPEETQFYLHDFDDVFLLSTDFNAFSGFNILAPMCTPLYACPVYYIFRNYLHTQSLSSPEKEQPVENAMSPGITRSPRAEQPLKEQIKEYYPYTIKILRGLACMGSLKPREIYNRIKEICNKICNFVLNASDGEIGYIKKAVENPAWLRNLIQYSDLYSWGACLIVQSMVVTDDGQKRILHNAGEICLINYFQRLKPTSGGRSKKLKKGGNGNGPTAVLPQQVYQPSFESLPSRAAMIAQSPLFDTVAEGHTLANHNDIKLTLDELKAFNNTKDNKYQIKDFAAMIQYMENNHLILAGNITDQTAEEAQAAEDAFYKDLASRHFTKIKPVEGPESVKITLPQ